MDRLTPFKDPLGSSIILAIECGGIVIDGLPLGTQSAMWELDID